MSITATYWTIALALIVVGGASYWIGYWHGHEDGTVGVRGLVSAAADALLLLRGGLTRNGDEFRELKDDVEVRLHDTLEMTTANRAMDNPLDNSGDNR